MTSLLIWLGVKEDRFEGLPIICVLALLVSSMDLISLNVRRTNFHVSCYERKKMTTSSNRQILIIQRTLCFSLSKAWRGHILRIFLSIIVHESCEKHFKKSHWVGGKINIKAAALIKTSLKPDCLCVVGLFLKKLVSGVFMRLAQDVNLPRYKPPALPAW